MNYYDLLEVSQNASAEVIRAAYKSLIQRYHPDKHPGDFSASKHAALIVEAYETLSDPEKRASFDRKLLEARRKVNVFSPSARRDDRRSAKSIATILLSVAAVLIVVSYIARDTWQSFRAGEQSNIRREKLADSGRPGTAPLVIARQLDVRLSNDDSAGAGKEFVLHVPSITLKIAANTESVRQRIKDAKAEIEPAIEQGLTLASYSRLIAPDGEAYLGTLVVDALVRVILAGYSQETQAELLLENFNDILEVGLPESYSVRQR